MLKRYSQVFKSLFFMLDMVVIFGCWILAYVLRLHVKLIPPFSNMPPFREHLHLSLFIIPSYMLVFKWIGLYKPARIRQIKKELSNIFRASSLSLLLVIFAIYFFNKEFYYSRLTFIYFWILNIAALSFFRTAIRKSLRELRKRGYNLRHILIVGSGDLAREVARKIRRHLEYGFNILGFLAKDSGEVDIPIEGINVLGSYKDLKKIIKNKDVDQVIFALPAKEERIIRVLLGYIDDESIDITVVPDLGNFFTLRKRMDELDGLPVITLRESPLYGWARLSKRIFDTLGSFFMVIFLSPLMCLIVLLIKLGSRGPIFYMQERVGLDSEKFNMYKFRTMRVDAEANTGPVLAKEDDARRTKIGRILRKTSLDELPQLFNVLRGDMSLVGPRPERPIFVDELRKHIPNYMLRHKIKTGITGWAQIHGWRGNTSFEKRIEYDLHYIEHWSTWLDLKILFLTIPAIIKGKGAC